MASSTGLDVSNAKSRKRTADSKSANGQALPKQPRIGGKTDYTRWRIKDDDSRHTWHYLADDKAAEEWPQSYADKYFLNLPLVCPALTSVVL